MPAYIIVEVEIHDPVEYEEYKKLTPGSLLPYQGKFIVRSGEAQTLEGDGDPKRIVVLEFPTKELAREWWASKEYTPAKEIRQRIATTRMILVQGVE